MNKYAPIRAMPAGEALEPPADAYAAAECFYAGDLPQALALAERALAQQPCSEAYGIIAAVNGALGEQRQEIAAYRAGLAVFPDDPVLAVNFARSLRQIPGRALEAVKILRAALERSPDSAPVHLALVETLRTSTQYSDLAEHEAVAYVARFPNEPNGHLALALIQLNRGALYDCLISAEECLARGGNAVRVWEVRANAFLALGSAEDTLACYREILALGPDADIHSRCLMAMQYCDAVTEDEIFAETNLWARTYAATPPRSQWPAVRFDPAQIRNVGILSRDFRRCSTLYLGRPLFENLPPEWRVTFYSTGEVTDGTTALFQSMCDRWVDLGPLDDDAAAQKIVDDGVEVLIDINGHTLGGRPTLLARKPAPVQIAWLDYVGTTGVAAMDAIIADKGHLPLKEQDRYLEAICHVADDLYRYAPQLDAPDVCLPPASKTGFVTFGCFNSAYKISATTIALWGDLLRALPMSRLILNAPEYAHADTCARFSALFAAQNIDASRIDFQPGSPHPLGMLQAYGDVDIALDPMPYSGGLTTLEALYMGVPVVTSPGRRFGSRHSAVHLRAMGLEDWIASDSRKYVALAMRKAADIFGLEVLRAGLRNRMERSPLMNGAALASDVVQIINRLWSKACRRQNQGTDIAS